MIYRKVIVIISLMCMSGLPTVCQSKNLDPAFARGCDQMMHKNFSSAIASFTEAISSDANDVNSYFRRGQSFFCLANYKDAVLDFDRAIAKGGLDPNAFLWRGTAYAKIGNDELAIRNYEKAMRLNPKLVEKYKSASLENQVSSNPNGSIEKQTAQIGVPENQAAPTPTATPVSDVNSERLRFASNQRAVDDYSTAVKNVIANLSGYFRPGTAYSGILNGSGELIPISGLNDPSEWIEGKQQGHSYLSLKDPGRDLRNLDSQIIARPQDANLYFQRARVFQQMGKADKTLADLTRAIDLDKTNPHYFLARAFYYFQKDEDDLAALEIRKAQELDPIVPEELSFQTPVDKTRTTKS